MKPELNKIEGTVAYILTQNSAKINACGMNVNAVKQCIRDLLTDPNTFIKDKKEAELVLTSLQKITTPAHLWSSMGTWMTGIKTIPTSKQRAARKDAKVED